jgi:hypothetical protein
MTIRKRCYQPATAHIVYDRFDDEVVIIDLNSGCYYSLREAAVEIWEMIERRPTAGEILASLGDVFSGPAEEMERDVLAFLDQLAAEGLVTTGDECGGGDAAAGISKDGLTGERRPFKIPEMTKYEDQKEILLLDPIHEVGDLGWPERK